MSTASSSQREPSTTAGEQKIEDLIKLIQRVKGSVNVPVTTGEIWNIWLEHPELASVRAISSRRTSSLLGRLFRQAGGRIRR